MKLQILYHGNCFDGLVSAAIFTRFFRGQVSAAATISYRPLFHGLQDPYGPDHDETFWADENAVVDFRYSPSPRLTWWCDHHQSTFIDPAHRKHFEHRSPKTHCYDPCAPSCAGLLARWLGAMHGFNSEPLSDQLYWADIIDSARFRDPVQAVELGAPALQLMALLESGPPSELIEQMLRGLVAGSLEQTYQLPAVQRALTPVLHAHRRMIERFRHQLEVAHGVAYVDLSAEETIGFNKFIPYYLREGISYTVVLTRTTQRTKISVGTNPWQRPESPVNIATLCGRYGGGGHPVVGAISLGAGELARSREIALEITNELREHHMSHALRP